MQHEAAIALGSNLGDSLSILTSAVADLDSAAEIQVLACSSWYQTAPVGPPQPDYLNGCLIMKTGFSPQKLMKHLLQVEAKFGRERRERWGARTLDLDLLLFDDVILDEVDLTIPHPRMNERAFVLVPLAEVAGDWCDPVTLQSIAQLVRALDCTGVKPLESALNFL